MSKSIYRPFVRKRKAYATAIAVTSSYFWIAFKRRLFGESYYASTIKDLHLRNATKIKNRILELEGLFIKIGQLISSLSNILPDEFREPLESLQDRIPPRDYGEIRKIIVAELGSPPEDIFESFDQEPLAAASIGQVHKAVLDGQDVVLKIQHSNINRIAKADLSILKRLTEVAAWFYDVKGTEHTYLQVKQTIAEELDYAREGKAMQQLAGILSDEEGVRVPKLIERFSTAKVLCIPFHEGVNIGNLKQIDEWGLDRKQLGKRIVTLFCRMITVEGYYHADPHPGNILVNQAGEITLLDYGAVAELGAAIKDSIPEFLEVLINDDTVGTVKVLQTMGFIGNTEDATAIARKFITAIRRFVKEEVSFDGIKVKDMEFKSGMSSVTQLLSDLDFSDLSETMIIPKDWIFLHRTLLLLTGTAFQLDPEIDLLNIVKPYLEEHVMKRKNWSELIENTLRRQVTTAIGIPQDLSRFLEKANNQELELKVTNFSKGLKLLYHLGQQILFAILMLLSVFFATNFQSQPFTWQFYLFVALGGLFLLLLLKAWFAGRKASKKL